jgi:predicted nucleotidyltransferase
VNELAQLAKTLGAPERTLRRAVALGGIRGRRLSSRRLRLAEGEVDYLLGHWALLAASREALRTEPHVRVAILAGSTARGDDRTDSDVDLVVDLIEEKPLDRMRLGMRLADKLERAVDVASLRDLRGDPLSLLQLLDEGRVLVDREGRWPELRAQRPAVHKRAKRAYLRQQQQTAATLEVAR